MTEIVEWAGTEQPVKELWFCQEEQGDATVQAQCVEAGGVALHVRFPGADEGDEDRRIAIYLTPAEAALFSEAASNRRLHRREVGLRCLLVEMPDRQEKTPEQREGRQSIEPTYDSRLTGDAYTVEVREGNKRIDKHAIADPFVNTTVRVRGWRNALRVLFRSYRCSVHVDASHDRVEDLFELNDDYKGEHGSTRREEWDTSFNRSLGDFAAVIAEHEDDQEHR